MKKSVKGGCAQYQSYNHELELIQCTTKLRYSCKVNCYNPLSNPSHCLYIFQIEISFPDSCFHPFQTKGHRQKKFKEFRWKANTALKIKKDTSYFKIASNASEADRKPGRPYYFACGAKTYMGIMEGVWKTYKLLQTSHSSYLKN